MVGNIMRHELTKEKLISFLLQNGIDDMDFKKEVKLRGINPLNNFKNEKY